MGAPNRLRKDWPLWTTIIAFFSAGMALILLPVLNEWAWDHGVVKEIGIAFLIAAILGGSIHTYLERDIAKDAFEGAVGYFLPPDMKEAVRYLISMDWFAEEFSWVVDIEPVDVDVVKVTTKTKKLLRNITNAPLPIKSKINIDDWGYSKKSNITQCELHCGAGVMKTFDPKKVQYRDDSTIYAETEEVEIRPGETATLLATGIEYKRSNGDIYFAMPYATRSAEIYVNAPNNFHRWGGFATDFPSDKDPHLDRYVVKGFCFPWQRAMVRWWPKEGAAAPARHGTANLETDANKAS